MCDDMFFIPVLLAALRHPDDIDALHQAFLHIHEKHEDARYRAGGEQWRRFLDAAIESLQAGGDEAIPEIAFRMILHRILNESETPDPDRVLSQHTSRHARARLIVAMRECADRPAPISLQFHREDDRIVSFPVPPGDNALVHGVRPGRYTVSLDTGQVLWSGQLEERDLCWHRAFPGRPLSAAAESDRPSITPSQHIPLSVGTLSIVVYPGVETGTLQLVEDEPLT